MTAMLIVALSASLFGMLEPSEVEGGIDQKKREAQQMAQDARAREATDGGASTSSLIPKETIFSPQPQNRFHPRRCQ